MAFALQSAWSMNRGHTLRARCPRKQRRLSLKHAGDPQRPTRYGTLAKQRGPRWAHPRWCCPAACAFSGGMLHVKALHSRTYDLCDASNFRFACVLRSTAPRSGTYFRPRGERSLDVREPRGLFAEMRLRNRRLRDAAPLELRYWPAAGVPYAVGFVLRVSLFW